MSVNPDAIPATGGEVAAPPGRFARAGSMWGFAGAICCVGNAVAVATGIGALSFFGVWMQRYQVYFVVTSIVAMMLAVTWMLRRYDRRVARRMLIRQVGIMAAAYVVTLGLATMVSGLITQ
jgi:hypothetical protein